MLPRGLVTDCKSESRTLQRDLLVQLSILVMAVEVCRILTVVQFEKMSWLGRLQDRYMEIEQLLPANFPILYPFNHSGP